MTGRIIKNFNTSYVSVQEKSSKRGSPLFLFQYILCVGSSLLDGKVDLEQTKFQYILCVGSRFKSACVIDCYIAFQYILCVGSSPTFPFAFCSLLLFQYILCVGSRLSQILYKDAGPHFNTSYVSVQACFYNSEGFNNVISIHLMCRFKSLKNLKKNLSFTFQYILCVGSSRA